MAFRNASMFQNSHCCFFAAAACIFAPIRLAVDTALLAVSILLALGGLLLR